MSADFLLELRSEEIPARMQAKARADLARLFAEGLQAAGLATEGIETFSTPRRLVLVARGLPDATAAASEEMKGPRANAPEQALAGFLKKTGLKREQLEERDGVLFARIDRPGRSASEVLAEVIASLIRDFPWPKSMRWGDGSLRWVRPLHGIVALLGEEIVPVEVDGIAAGAATVGHRFHHPGAITIGGADDYFEKLRACHVIVDQEERQAIIRDGAAKLAKDAGLNLVEDEGLVVENAGLTEWPVPLLGRFDPDFLEVPREVIVLTMRTNQKYFACTDDAGALAPAFVCVANIDANDNGKAIVEGNRRVLAARLSDARFFWEQDLKVPLEEQAAKLSGIVFHDKLGTVADKVERVAKLARWLVEQHIVTPAKAGAQPNKEKLGSRVRGNDEEVKELANQAERAARLAKADLVTGMVGEFPELQGVIGGYLAERQSEPKAIADAIRDHYKPAGQGDEVPTAPVTVAVSLADKLDSLVGFFAAQERPTGSRDPFALRRAALGCVAIIANCALGIPLLRVFGQTWKGHAETLLAGRAPVVLMMPKANFTGGDFTLRAPDNLIFDCTYKLVHLISHIPVDSDFISLAWIPGGSAESGGDTDYGKFRDAFDIELLAPARVSTDLLDFFADRLKVQQREAGVRHDLIDAVFALGGEDDLVRLLARVAALQAFVETSDGRDLLTAYKRAANILKKENWDLPRVMSGKGAQGIPQTGEEDPLVLVEEPAIAEAVAEMASGSATPADAPAEEKALVAALDDAGPRAAKAVEGEDFTAAMAALASLRGPIDAFFDKVTVNDADKAARSRRLNLLARFRDAVHEVADFSKIEG